MDKITIELYTANSVAVFGNTIAIKEHFKRIGGTYNANLKGSDGESKRKGWIFPKSKLQDVRDLLVEYSNNTLDTSYVHQSKQPSVQQMLQPTPQPVRQKPEPADNSDEFVFTHKMYLSLVSRIERLEAELVIAKKALAGTITNSASQPVQKQPKKKVVEYDEEEEEEEERPTPVKPVQETEIQEIEEIQPKRLLRNKKQKEPEINL